jgi:hypothetical protein
MQGRDAAAGTFRFSQGVAHKILLMRNNSARMIWVIVAYALLVNLRHQQTFHFGPSAHCSSDGIDGLIQN